MIPSYTCHIFEPSALTVNSGWRQLICVNVTHCVEHSYVPVHRKQGITVSTDDQATVCHVCFQYSFWFIGTKSGSMVFGYINWEQCNGIKIFYIKIVVGLITSSVQFVGGWEGLTPHWLRTTPLLVTEKFGLGSDSTPTERSKIQICR